MYTDVDVSIIKAMAVAVESVQKKEKKFAEKKFIKKEFTEKGRNSTANLKAEEFIKKGRNQIAYLQAAEKFAEKR